MAIAKLCCLKFSKPVWQIWKEHINISLSLVRSRFNCRHGFSRSVCVTKHKHEVDTEQLQTLLNNSRALKPHLINSQTQSYHLIICSFFFFTQGEACVKRKWQECHRHVRTCLPQPTCVAALQLIPQFHLLMFFYIIQTLQPLPRSPWLKDTDSSLFAVCLVL